jgi:putative ABC transport system substrate-binding protein
MRYPVIKGFFLSVVLVITILLQPMEAGSQKRIGILMFSDEVRYNEATKGVIDQLKQEGFGEPGVKFIKESGGANKAKTAELVKQFAEAKMDLIVTMGTSATVPIAREIKDVPIVFCVVYDPVEAGIAKDWKSSGNNTTGTSTKQPMSMILEALKKLSPVGKLAVLYNPAEKNSEGQLRDLQDVQAKYRIKVIPVPLGSKEDIIQVMPEVVRTSDSIFITGSNVINAQVSTIVDMATKAGVITITHLEDLVEKGVLLGVCTGSYKSGRLAGKKAAKILKGAKPSSIPIEKMKETELILNMKTARAGQFRISPEFIKNVKRKIE